MELLNQSLVRMLGMQLADAALVLVIFMAFCQQLGYLEYITMYACMMC